MTIAHQSPIFELSDEYIAEAAKLSPITATFLGIPGYNDQLDDFSLQGSQKKPALIRETLRKLADLKPQDDNDRIAAAVMQERLTSELALYDSYENQLICAVIASPVISIRQVFEIMPYGSSEEIRNFTLRFNAVKSAHDSWRSCLNDLARIGKRTTKRQARGVADQLKAFSGGAYSGIAKRIDPDNKYPELHTAAASADKSAGEMGEWLRTNYLPEANEADGVGAERYSSWARHYTGANLDLRETYEWGLKDLARINERMWKAALKIKPNAKSLQEVADYLDEDPKYLVKGSDTLLKKLKEFTEAAVKQMDGIYFDIDDRIKFCDARLAPEGSAAAPYYIPSSEDLARPGTTWFPTLGKDEFNWWRIPTMWYHEAVPGHHLQNGTTTVEIDRLTRFQRTEAWTSGYGEGWALYAERLMDELGAFEDPGFEMGYLSAQAWRAVRVVVDIGMHLGYKDENGKVWTAESAALRRLGSDYSQRLSHIPNLQELASGLPSHSLGRCPWRLVYGGRRRSLGYGQVCGHGTPFWLVNSSLLIHQILRSPLEPALSIST